MEQLDKIWVELNALRRLLKSETTKRNKLQILLDKALDETHHYKVDFRATNAIEQSLRSEISAFKNIIKILYAEKNVLLRKLNLDPDETPYLADHIIKEHIGRIYKE